MTDVKLEEHLVWREDGCLAEPAMHAVADAELELLPEEAREHAVSCAWCAEHIGRIAVLSLEIEEALAREQATQTVTAAVRRRLPIVPVALALLIALTCKLPLLRQLDVHNLGRSAASLTHMLVTVLLKLIVQLTHTAVGSALVLCSALFLIAGSALLTRSGWFERAIREPGGKS